VAEPQWASDAEGPLDHLWDAMNDIGGTIIIVLDEIDNLGTDDKILYSPLVRAIRITLTTTSIRRSSALATTFNGVTTSTPAAKDSLRRLDFLCPLRCGRTPRYPFPPCEQHP